MRVFKFGGASVKDSAGVKKLEKIISLYKGEPLMIVISAMGKTTNLMEKIVDAWYKDTNQVKPLFEQLAKFHYSIIDDLGNYSQIVPFIDPIFKRLSLILDEDPSEEFDYEYDKIVPFGEYLSTTIVSAYLNARGINNELLDAAKMIRTDNRFRGTSRLGDYPASHKRGF